MLQTPVSTSNYIQNKAKSMEESVNNLKKVAEYVENSCRELQEIIVLYKNNPCDKNIRRFSKEFKDWCKKSREKIQEAENCFETNDTFIVNEKLSVEDNESDKTDTVQIRKKKSAADNIIENQVNNETLSLQKRGVDERNGKGGHSGSNDKEEREILTDSEKENIISINDEEENELSKNKIRVVALEKLLDPNILESEKSKRKIAQTAKSSDQSIVILDDDDDDVSLVNVESTTNSSTKEPSHEVTVNKNCISRKSNELITETPEETSSEKNEENIEIEKSVSKNTFRGESSSVKTYSRKDEKKTETKRKSRPSVLEIIKKYNIRKAYVKMKRSSKINEMVRAYKDSSNSKRPLSSLGKIKDNKTISRRKNTENAEVDKDQISNNSLKSARNFEKNKGTNTKKVATMSNSDSDSNNADVLNKTMNNENMRFSLSSDEEIDERNSLKITDGECTSMGGLKYKFSLKLKKGNKEKQSSNSDSEENDDSNQNNRDGDTNSPESPEIDSKSGDEENDSKTDSEDKISVQGKESSDESFILRKRRKKNKSNKDKTSHHKHVDKDSDEEKSEEKKKRRKRIRNVSGSDSGSGSDSDALNKKRKNIRKLIKARDLDSETKIAGREEIERRKRIEERQKLYNSYYETPESIELKELVLDFDEKTKAPLLKVDEGILKKLKPHQATGVKFMWDACFETLKDTKNKPGSGCILAHCMGLGKTLQVVTLVHTLLTNSKKTNVERVMVIAPLSTLNNWAREFTYWMKFSQNRNIELYDMSKWKDKKTRIFKLKEWFDENGVCIIGYDMFRILLTPTGKSKKQRETLNKCLVDPGPDLVICDEGHLLKNEKTSLSKSVNKMKTLRRIVLTGTPLQNNLKEYYCMIQFVKPNLLGTFKEYMNRFVNPITNGQYTDSTERDIRLMKNRSHVLHKLLEGCIQRRDYSVLAPYLPPKHEYVVFIQLTELQKKLYEFFMASQKQDQDLSGKGARLFQDFCNLRRIWTHPIALKINSDNVFKKHLKKGFETDEEGSLKDFIDDEEATTTNSSSSDTESCDSIKSDSSLKQNKTRAMRRTRQNANQCIDSDVEIIENKEERPEEWWNAICPEEALKSIYESPKLVLLLHILDECEKIGDKLLLFSQSLQSLDVIEHFLSLIDQKTQGEEIDGNVGDYKGSWTPGVDYFRLDGSRTVDNRDAMCKSFNDKNNLRARLFLISTRAGGLGINLVAANRVIIFDVSWNPSHDTQSIFRVYRFGQEKPCYIYRFIALGTMEEKIYERQVAKQATAKRVLDEQQISRHYNQNDLLELYNYELTPTTPKEIPILPKDRLFADLLAKNEQLIFKYHEHDSLLENEESEHLTEEERKAAWEEFEAEKNRPAYQPTYVRTTYDTMNGPITSNKIFGFRNDVLLKLLNMKASRDHPELSESEIYGMVPAYMQRLFSEVNNKNFTLYQELNELTLQLQMPQPYYTNRVQMAPATGVNMVNINPYWALQQQQQQQQRQQQMMQPTQSIQPRPSTQNIPSSNTAPSTSSSRVE